MIKFSKKYAKVNGGQVVILSVVTLVLIGILVVSGLVSPTVRESKIASDNVMSKQSLFLSESGVEDAYYRVRTNKTIASPTTIVIENHSATTTIVDSGEQKIISGQGDVLNRDRTHEIVIAKGAGVSFNYGVQSGSGGFTMANNSSVIGNVYSNGSITGSGDITGTALSANSEALDADQTNGTGTPSNNVTFGDTNATQDFAQGFQVDVTGVVNKVELYLKKVSTPANLTVRIVTNNNGAPSITTLASGVLSASLVSTAYGWVSVPFSSNPELTAGVTYWIVIDGVTSATKYYVIGANTATYWGGNSKIGRYTVNWDDNSPSNLDAFFKLYLGGVTGLISGIEVGTGSIGNAYAHTINSSTIHGTKYCQSTNNSPACNTTLPDPTQVPMPISDQNILDWKDEALVGGTHSGDYVVTSGNPVSFGPKKITGNLTVNNGGTLTMTGTLWVQGDIDISNNATINLDPSYGAGAGVIIADGTINIGNNAEFNGSGSANSYILVLSTSTSANAINLSNNAGAAVLYAANGTVNLSNNATAKSLNGKYINLEENSTVVYDSGLVNSTFVSGPAGSWNPIKWKEVQ